MTRLTDLIRGQSSQGAVNSDAHYPTRAHAPTDLPIPPPTPSPSVAEIDWYQRACHELARLKQAIQAKQPWTLGELAKVASGMVASIGTDDGLVRRVLLQDAGDYLVTNAVNVAVVSVKIAVALRYEPAKLEQVALAGLLHDLGMFVLPDSLVYKAGTLTEGELQQVREHPRQGVRLLKDVEGAYPWLERVMLQEHERWDGNGYPQKLTGNQIDEMALVIGLADVFDALMSSRPYRSGVLPHRAIRALLVNGKTVFPHHLLKALVDQLSIYPLGTAVRLSSGEIGVVSQLNRQYPLRPILHVLQQAVAGRQPLSKTMDLRTETFVHIVEVVPNDRLSGDPR